MKFLEHNKRIAILHIIYGGLNSLVFLGCGILLLLGGFAGFFDPFAGEVVLAVTWLFVGLSFLLFLLVGLPSLVAGYGLLTFKSWARTAAITASIVATLNVPFGTALAVYTLWFLFKDGRQLYDGLPLSDIKAKGFFEGSHEGMRNDAARGRSEGFREYLPPLPPSWRD